MPNEEFYRRMNVLEKRVETHDEILRGDSENEGLLSLVRQLTAESKQRKYIQVSILIGIVGLLLDRVFRMLGLLIDKI